MAIALRGTPTTSGTADDFTSSKNVPVPTGASVGDIAVLVVEHWTSAPEPTVTFPAGFTEITGAHANLATSIDDVGNQGIRLAWKRLTAADTGSYSITFSTTVWNMAHCVMFSGAIASGDPIEASNTATATSGYPTTTVTVATAAGVINAAATAGARTTTPPTSFTEQLDHPVLHTNTRILTGGATVTASGGTISGATEIAVAMIAVKPATTDVTGTGSVTAPLAVVAGTGSVGAVSIAASGALTAPAAVLSGAGSATVSGTGTATAPVAVVTGHESAFRYVTGISGNGRYFVDQSGDPILIRGDSPWSMFTDLSSTEMDTYLENRASYGTNVLLVSMVGSVANGAPNDNGATYDGILPFVSGNPTNFNSTYWSRMDAYIGKARDLGITLMIYPMDGWNCTFGGTVFDPGAVTNSQCQTYGNTLATRYASYPNIIWAFGGDYNENTDINDRFNACLTGIRAAGNTAPVTIQLDPEKSLSDDSAFWEPKVDFNFVYTYFVTYKGMKDGYDHVWSGAPTTRPALWSEGAYENSFDPHFGTDLVIRRQAGWALTSGSPGEFTGQEGVWNFNADWETRLDTTAADQLKVIRDTVESVEWWKLVPDDANQLVTAGRGTRITTDSATYPSSNTYVTAARAADKTLAVIYMPTASSAITVDMSQIGANPTATWVDPTNGTTVAATPGSTYSRGNNAAGSADWLLVLTGDAVSSTGSGSATAPTATSSGAGSVITAGAGSAVSPTVVVAGLGTVRVAGSGAVTAPQGSVSGFGNLGTPSVTGALGSVPINGTGGVVAPPATASGTGGVHIDGNGSLVTPTAIITGTGAVVIQGSGSVTAPPASVQGSMSSKITRRPFTGITERP